MKPWVPPVVDDDFLKRMTDVIVETVHPDEIMLFGSRARGDNKLDSDVDLLVVVPDAEISAARPRSLSGEIYRALMHFLIAKDILVFTSSEANRMRKDRMSVVSQCYREGK